jgi:hypothetical protein
LGCLQRLIHGVDRAVSRGPVPQPSDGSENSDKPGGMRA